MSTFKERLLALGFDSYDAYLRSSHWREFRASYRCSGRLQRCRVCDSTPIQLHHHNYSRIGHEKLDDVTPLCESCHSRLHEFLKARGLFVSATELALKHLGVAVIKWVRETREERIEREAKESVERLSSLRSEYVKFYRGAGKGQTIPKAALKRRKKRGRR